MGLWEMLKGEQPGIIRSILNYENLGQFGEYSTEFALTNNNLPGNLIVLKNVYVPYQGRTSEIDLLMIHEKGIFVFESKNYSGWILAVLTNSTGHNPCKMEKNIISIILFAKIEHISKPYLNIYLYPFPPSFLTLFSPSDAA